MPWSGFSFESKELKATQDNGRTRGGQEDWARCQRLLKWGRRMMRVGIWHRQRTVYRLVPHQHECISCHWEPTLWFSSRSWVQSAWMASPWEGDRGGVVALQWWAGTHLARRGEGETHCDMVVNKREFIMEWSSRGLVGKGYGEKGAGGGGDQGQGNWELFGG